MGFGDPFDNGKAESEAAVGGFGFAASARLVHSIEALKDARGITGSNTDAGIRDADADLLTLAFHRSDYLASGRRVADRIIEQVEHHAAEQFFIALEADIAEAGAFELDIAGIGARLDGAAAFGHNVVEVKLFTL